MLALATVPSSSCLPHGIFLMYCTTQFTVSSRLTLPRTVHYVTMISYITVLNCSPAEVSEALVR